MKSYLIILIAILLPSLITAQDSLRHYCSIDDGFEPETIYSVTPSRQAQRIIDTLLKHIPVSKNTISFYATDVRKACAAIANGKRVVYFNEEYLEQIQKNKQTRWTVYFVLAHEVAHHLNADPLDESKDRKTNELEADCQAAKILAKMGATKDETLAVIDLFKSYDTETHPRSSARKAKARNCWFDAKEEPVDKNKPIRIENCKGENGAIVIDNAKAQNYVIEISVNGYDENSQRAKRIIGSGLRNYHIGGVSKKRIELPSGNYQIVLYPHGNVFLTQRESVLIKPCVSYPIFIER